VLLLDDEVNLVRGLSGLARLVDDYVVVLGPAPHLDLGVASAISGGNIEVDSTRRLMKSIDFDEQQALVAVRVEDHALLIPRFVGIVGVAEYSLPTTLRARTRRYS